MLESVLYSEIASSSPAPSSVSKGKKFGKEMYIIDVSGTIVNDKQFISSLENAFDKYAAKYYAEEKGLSQPAAKVQAEKGTALREKGSKNSNGSAYQTYLKMQDEVAAYAYQKGKLSLDIFYEAAVAIRHLAEEGKTVVIYSSGLKHTFKPAFKSAKMSGGKTLDDFISFYFSSFDIGDKDKVSSFRAIANKMGISLKNAVFVDDKEENAKTAVKAGVKKVYVISKNPDRKKSKDKSSEEYYVIQSIKQILDDDENHNHETESSKQTETSEESSEIGSEDASYSEAA